MEHILAILRLFELEVIVLTVCLLLVLNGLTVLFSKLFWFGCLRYVMLLLFGTVTINDQRIKGSPFLLTVKSQYELQLQKQKKKKRFFRKNREEV